MFCFASLGLGEKDANEAILLYEGFIVPVIPPDTLGVAVDVEAANKLNAVRDYRS